MSVEVKDTPTLDSKHYELEKYEKVVGFLRIFLLYLKYLPIAVVIKVQTLQAWLELV